MKTEMYYQKYKEAKELTKQNQIHEESQGSSSDSEEEEEERSQENDDDD